MSLFENKQIEISSITILPERARTDFGDIPELANDIQRVGLLEPILLTEDLTLLAGERRLRAHEHLGLLTIDSRIMIGVDPSDYEIIEFMENNSRKDFLWHEELAIKLKMHTKWVSTYDDWNYRKSAAKLHVSLGGLSADLEFASVLNVFPELKLAETKGKAKEGYKKLAQQAEAIQSIESLPTEDQQSLVELLRGRPESAGEKRSESVIVQGKTDVQDAQKNPEGNHKDNEKTPEKTPVPALPKHAYKICDCHELLSDVPDNSVGFCELDPPYAMDFDNLGIYANAQATEADWSFEKYEAEMTKLFPVLYNKMLTKSFVVCWCAHRHAFWTNELAKSFGFKIQLPGIWCKPGGSSIRPNQNMVSNYETFIILAKDNAVFNTKSFKACINHSSVNFSDKSHQWEKPTEMYQEFFDSMGKPGAIFLSPFAGSGNSMLVAAKNDMIPIGADIQQKYYFSFTKRFNDMFGGG